MVHFWILQEAKGEDRFTNSHQTSQICHFTSYFHHFRHWQGLKKPYNPIIGETFRCLWIHARTNSKTFYIAEQVKQQRPFWFQLISIELHTKIMHLLSSRYPIILQFQPFMSVTGRMAFVSAAASWPSPSFMVRQKTRSIKSHDFV